MVEDVDATAAGCSKGGEKDGSRRQGSRKGDGRGVTADARSNTSSL